MAVLEAQPLHLKAGAVVEAAAMRLHGEDAHGCGVPRPGKHLRIYHSSSLPPLSPGPCSGRLAFIL